MERSGIKTRQLKKEAVSLDVRVPDRNDAYITRKLHGWTRGMD